MFFSCRTCWHVFFPRCLCFFFFFFFQAEDGIRDGTVTGVQTCALPILWPVARGTGERRATRYPETSGTLGRRRLTPRAQTARSEERRVGKECRTRWAPEHEKKKEKNRDRERKKRKTERKRTETVGTHEI